MLGGFGILRQQREYREMNLSAKQIERTGTMTAKKKGETKKWTVGKTLEDRKRKRDRRPTGEKNQKNNIKTSKNGVADCPASDILQCNNKLAKGTASSWTGAGAAHEMWNQT